MSFVQHLFVSNGFIFGPLMLLTGLALAGLIVSLAFGLRRGKAVGRNLVPRLAEAAAVGPARMSELTQGNRSLLAEAVAAGVARLPHGLEEARHAVAGVVERGAPPRSGRCAGWRPWGCYAPCSGCLAPCLA